MSMHRIQVINSATSSAPVPYNQHSAFSTTVAKPALGPSFAFLTDVTVWLSHHYNDGEDGTNYIAEVFKSNNTVSWSCPGCL